MLLEKRQNTWLFQRSKQGIAVNHDFVTKSELNQLLLKWQKNKCLSPLFLEKVQVIQHVLDYAENLFWVRNPKCCGVIGYQIKGCTPKQVYQTFSVKLVTPLGSSCTFWCQWWRDWCFRIYNVSGIIPLTPSISFWFNRNARTKKLRVPTLKTQKVFFLANKL